MVLAIPVAMSIVGNAVLVRHVHTAGKSWAVFTTNDGSGDQFWVRERTGSVVLVPPITGLRTDSADFLEIRIDTPALKVDFFHVLSVPPNNGGILFSDGKKIFYFSYDFQLKQISIPITEISTGVSPSQFVDESIIRRFYIKNNSVYIKVGNDDEYQIIRQSLTEPLAIDTNRKGETAKALYAGRHSINRNLPLPYKADINTVLIYDGNTDEVSVTESMPPGVVSRYTFDDAHYSGSTILDQVGANNGSLVGAAPVSAAAPIGQGRQFSGLFSSGNYDLGNPASLQITGSLSVGMLARVDSAASDFSPYSKDIAGEGIVAGFGLNHRKPQQMAFQWGSGGVTQTTASIEPYPLGQFFHFAVTRDATSRLVRTYINGEMTNQERSAFAAAASTVTTAKIGRYNSGLTFPGVLDELLIANQAWSPATVKALAQKNLAGQPSTASGSGSVSILLDAGPSSRHLTLGRAGRAGGRLFVAAPGVRLAGGAIGYSAGSALTIEAMLYPRGSGDRVLFGNLSDPLSSGTRIEGCVGLLIDVDGRLLFSFDTTSSRVTLKQTGGLNLITGEINHVAVSHTFGSGGSSFLMINGDQVPSTWLNGSGNETPTMNSSPPYVQLAPGDELASMRVSNIAKTASAVRTHLQGRQ